MGGYRNQPQDNSRHQVINIADNEEDDDDEPDYESEIDQNGYSDEECHQRQTIGQRDQDAVGIR